MGKNPSFVGQIKVGPTVVVFITVVVGTVVVVTGEVKVTLVVVGATVVVVTVLRHEATS